MSALSGSRHGSPLDTVEPAANVGDDAGDPVEKEVHCDLFLIIKSELECTLHPTVVHMSINPTVRK